MASSGLRPALARFLPSDDNFSAVTAKQTPQYQLMSAAFWIRHPLFLVSTAMGALAIRYSFPLAVGGNSTNVGGFISLLIFAVWAIAVVQASHALAAIHVNRAVACCVHQNSEKILRAIKGSSGPRPAITQLAGRVLPDNDSKPAASRMVAHILTEAEDREFGFSGNVAEMYREETRVQVIWTERLQQLALRLGILGTFIGLATALRAVPLRLRELFQTQHDAGDVGGAFLRLSGDLVGGLSDAFGTSVAGLVAASGVWLLAYVLRMKQNKYYAELDRTAEVVTALARNAANLDKFHENFRKLIDRLDDLRRQLVSRVDELAKDVVDLGERVMHQSTRLDAQSQVVDAQTSTIKETLEQLATAKVGFRDFLDDCASQQKFALSRLDGMFERADLPLAFERLEKSTAGLSGRLSDTIQTSLANALSGQVAPVQAAVEDVGSQIVKIREELLASTRTATDLGHALSGLSSAVCTSFPPRVSSAAMREREQPLSMSGLDTSMDGIAVREDSTSGRATHLILALVAAIFTLISFAAIRWFYK